ncbi:MAG: peptide ligase PGM1-related protein [Gaiellaceae bacterium]
MTAVDTLPVGLGLDPEEAQTRFDGLQEKLVPLWHSMERLTQDEQTIVVVCSMTLEDVNVPAAVVQAYEERFLFLLLLLRQPRARLVYVTSQAVHPSIVDYYLGLLPGIIPSHARQRLHLVSPLDGSSRPLSEKLLERPRLLEQIRRLVPDPDRAHLIPFNTTELERDLALALGIPMYGADPRFFPYGTKTGCRRLFAEQGVRHPLGREDLSTTAELAAAIAELRAGRPGMSQVIVKLNEGVSGEGNALLSLDGLSDGAGEAEIEERLRELQFELPEITYDTYTDMLEKRGAVVEERIVGDEFRSPSVQMRVTPLGKLEVLSTHDQLLGGPSGQSYLGCIFPADSGYATAITREAVKVGGRLAKEGVIGRFAMDFVAVKGADGGWEPYAIELNLRKGGTTHPFLTLQFLTDGAYDPEAAIFTAPSGKQKFFVASDHVESPAYRALTAEDLFDLAVRTRLHFDQSRQTGVVFHMMSALGEWGRTGLTAVEESPEQAYALYERAVTTVDEEAQTALAERRLP